MDTLEVVYYTCLNNDCPKHRNIFREDDAEHENCERERLWLEGQKPGMPGWAWFAIAAGLGMAAAAAALILRMRPSKPQQRTLREETEMKTWSGAQSHRDDREGNAVPPPISTASLSLTGSASSAWIPKSSTGT